VTSFLFIPWDVACVWSCLGPTNQQKRVEKMFREQYLRGFMDSIGDFDVGQPNDTLSRDRGGCFGIIEGATKDVLAVLGPCTCRASTRPKQQDPEPDPDPDHLTLNPSCRVPMIRESIWSIRTRSVDMVDTEQIVSINHAFRPSTQTTQVSVVSSAYVSGIPLFRVPMFRESIWSIVNR
jgi:hypothetical protein